MTPEAILTIGALGILAAGILGGLIVAVAHDVKASRRKNRRR